MDRMIWICMLLAPISVRAQVGDQESEALSAVLEAGEELVISALNEADESTLEASGLLTAPQIQDILNYRENYGDFVSRYELQGIASLDLPVIRQLLHFFTIEEKPLDYSVQPGQLKNRRQQQYILYRTKFRTERKKGQKEHDFTGKLPYQLVKLRMRPGKKSEIGVSMENDEGESPAWRPDKNQFGSDFLSFFYRHRSSSLQWILGDYTFSFGQGITASSGFGLGKGSESILGLPASLSGIRPYSSLNETGYVRGLALSWEFDKRWQLIGTTGLVVRDATIHDGEYFSSFQETGLHRTGSEQTNRATVRDRVSHFQVNYRPDKFTRLGIAYTRDELSLPRKTEHSGYQESPWQGRHHESFSLSLERTRHNWFTWFEFALSQWHRHALQAGTLIRLTGTLSTSLVVRSYAPGFDSFYGKALSERSGVPSNEAGVYWGWEYSPDHQWKFNGYLDLFSFPMGSATVYPPGTGKETLLRASFTYHHKLSVILKLRQETKPVNTPDSDIRGSSERTISQAMTHLQLTLNRRLEFRGRLEWKKVSGSTLPATALYLEVIRSWNPFSLSVRYSLFQAEDYTSRIFFYERDVWGTFSLPSYYGTGLRYYLLGRWKLSKNTDLWLRIARTSYIDRSVLGNGSDEIDQPHRTDITCQLKINL